MTANWKRIVIWATITIVLLGMLLFAFMPRAIMVDLITLQPSSMAVTVDAEGQTRIHDVFILSAPVAGRVLRIDAHVGDRVIANETILAKIEPADPAFLDPRSEAQSQAALYTAESALDQAQATVEQAEAELDYAAAEVRRARELIAEGTISQRALDEAERLYKTQNAGLRTAQAGLQMRMFELEQARAALLSPTETQQRHGLCDCVPIMAPVNGRVLQIINFSERVVAAGEPLMEIGDPEDMEVWVDFLSADAVRIQAGQAVIMTGWGGDQPLQGQVRYVEPFGFTKVSALGIEEQRVNVIIDFVSVAEDWGNLGHGYQVDASVVLWEQSDILAVPLIALFRYQQHWAVFVMNNGRAILRHVELGQRNGVVAEILTGLTAGEQVVLHPNNRVLDGIRITARN